MFTDKLNLFLIKIFKYLSSFNLNIHYESKKQHLIFDIL